MNKSDKEFLASILTEVSQAIYTGNTSILDGMIQKLTTTHSVKYPDAPEGATHIDLNDDTDSKWIKVDGGYFHHYTNNGAWFCITDPSIHSMNLEAL